MDTSPKFTHSLPARIRTKCCQKASLSQNMKDHSAAPLDKYQPPLRPHLVIEYIEYHESSRTKNRLSQYLTSRMNPINLKTLQRSHNLIQPSHPGLSIEPRQPVAGPEDMDAGLMLLLMQVVNKLDSLCRRKPAGEMHQ